MSIASLRRKANNLRKQADRAMKVGAKDYADTLLKQAVEAENILVGQAAATAAREGGKELDRQRVSWSAELDKKLIYIGIGTGVTLFGLYIVTRRT